LDIIQGSSFINNYEKERKEIQAMSPEQLETETCALIKQIPRGRFHFEKHRKLTSLLVERANRLNYKFAWTRDAIDKFVYLNEEIISSCEKANVEARSIIEACNQRIKAKDAFLNDFEIRIVLLPFILQKNEKTGGYSEPVDGSIDDFLNFCMQDDTGLNFDPRRNFDTDEILYLQRYEDWRDTTLWPGSENFKMCYGMHVLMYHIAELSIPDILRIKDIWAEVQVRYQHFLSVIHCQTSFSTLRKEENYGY
jgi:hypothetical protein